MPTRIDAFAHILPPEFRERMLETHPTDELENMWFEQLWNPELRIKDMDDFGIDKQVLTLADPPIWAGMDPDDALPLTRLANDLVRNVADEYPDRFIPTATLPFLNADFVEEFDRCIQDLDIAGVQIFSNVDGHPIDSPGHMALYEAAERADVPVWIHPNFHEWYSWLHEFELRRALGWPFDTSVAMARLVFSGVFERYPDLAVITHHLGGMIPYYVNRIATSFQSRVEHPDLYPDFEAPDFTRPVEEHFRQFYGDTVIAGSERSLMCARDFFGDDRVVYATDYPFGPEDGRTYLRKANRLVDSVDDAAAREAIYAESIESLL